MIACVQRVSEASVTVAGEVVGKIGKGMVVLLGVADGDGEAITDKLADKVTGLRIFEDDAGKMNLSLQDVGGEMLVVSQFTLLADCKKGRRPSFIAAAAPEVADQLYQRFSNAVASAGIAVANGRFQANMQVALVNDGPVTIVIDTDRW